MIIPSNTLYLIKEIKSFLKLTQYTMTALLTLEKLTVGSLFSVCLPSYGLLSTREVRVTSVTLGP